MQIEDELAKVKPRGETLLTVGVFDGVHLGHQRLLTHLRDEAKKRNWLSGVVTFKSHPQMVLSAGSNLLWLGDLESRIDLLRSLGMDVIVALPFTPELAQMTAPDFVQLLREHLKMRGLIVGPDFALGRNREGDADGLRLLGKEMSFSVEVIPPIVLDGEVISSSAVRQALAEGDMKRVERLFGRPFTLRGQVVSGDERGRTLGYPTANLDVKPEQALPSDGVYVTVAHIDGESLPSVTNVGVRPTFGGGKRLVETYLLDYEWELREQRLRIDLVDKLRDEKRFNNAEELKAQITKDVEQARAIFDKRMRKCKS
ncbi:MAG: bifunctional riboflavin kinase/FAD synthetase [Dehalococcoidia bacterium]|nr:bifunctional riboflavin kinase/FAD synthetase [Dehalococcoidia bacterium]